MTKTRNLLSPLIHRGAALAIFGALFAALLLPACGMRESKLKKIPAWPSAWYTTPAGVIYGFIGPWPGHAADYYPSDDDLDEEYLTKAEVGVELDRAIDAAAAAHGQSPALLRALVYVVVDDFGFATSLSPTGFAAGMTDSRSYVMIGLWTRYEGTPDPASIPAGSPSWTHRPPGLNGYTMWRYGHPPDFPAMAHEACHVYFPTSPCGHKATNLN